MTDREKVIKGLECCVSTVKDCGPCPTECPYYWKCVGGDNGIYFDLMKDTLSLLKEQEPVKHGRWVHFNSEEYLDPRMVCSAYKSVEVPHSEWQFCPYCGAKMDLQVDDDEDD